MLALSLFTWQPNVLPQQMLVQVLCAFSLVLVTIRTIMQEKKQQHEQIWLLDEDGRVVMAHEPSGQTWQLTDHSRISAFMLWVHLRHIASTKQQWKWLFVDQLSEKNFRRVSKIISRMQRKPR